VKRVEELVVSANYQPLMPFYAEQRTDSVTLHLSSFSEAEARAVAALLARSPKFTGLTFAPAGIGQNFIAFQLLISALACNTQLQKLDLTQNGLGSLGAQKLQQALEKHPTLQELCICNNHIGCAGAAHVAELLKLNTTITALDLAENSIGNQGMMSLLQGLAANSVLQWLSLQHNHIGPECEDNIWETMDLVDMGSATRLLDARSNRRGLSEKFTTRKISPPLAAEGALPPLPSSRRMLRTTL